MTNSRTKHNKSQQFVDRMSNLQKNEVNQVIPRSFTRSSEIIPEFMRKNFKLVIPFQTATVAGGGTLQYPLNSPRFNNASPAGFYQLLSFFARWRVVKSKIKVTCTSNSSYMVQMCILPSVDGLPSPSFTLPQQQLENPLSSYVTLGPAGTTASVVSVENQIAVSTLKGTPLGQDPYFYGANSVKFTGAGLTNYTNTGDPATLFTWGISYGTVGSTYTFYLNGFIEFEYDVEFSDRYDLNI
jgi:hypothetical protein